LAINAIAIAKAVNIPKYIVGMKFDRPRIEKPTMIIIEVK
jgi:hypothetical protein